jgi:hypothetical protein
MNSRCIALAAAVAFVWLALNISWPAWAVAILFLAALGLSARDIWYKE